METSEAVAEDKLSTIVEYLPPVPEAYAFEEQADDSFYRRDSLRGQPFSGIGVDESFDNAEDATELNGYFPTEESAAVATDSPPANEPSTSAPAPSEPISNDLENEEPTPTKRSLRVKTRKRIYQDENSEGELASEEESLFPRVSTRYYSDDEYVPGNERKSKKRGSDQYESEEDEEIVEDQPRRKRKRKKAGEQSTPVKSPKKTNSGAKRKGRAAKNDSALDPAAPSPSVEESQPNGTSEILATTEEPVTLDSDSDIENCLQISKIKVLENVKIETSTSSTPNGHTEPKPVASKEPKNETSNESKDDVSKKSKTASKEKKRKPKENASKKKESETSEMGKVFENFLTTKTELQIKKVIKKEGSVTSQLDIPMIEPPEIIKLIDSWTQTEVKEVRSTPVQTGSLCSMRINKSIPLTTQQAENACEMLKHVLKMTTDLGTLMCEKAEEVISKKINTEYIKDTTKIAFCKEKSALLFKLAKDNLTKMEEKLEKNYEEFINNNDLTSAVEVDKKIIPKMPEEDNSDCEIVEVTKQEPKKKPNANTVFLNKELSIKIAKKPAEAVKVTPQGRQIKVSGRHAVWINKSVMVKKVNRNQSFLAQDRRFDKPPDKIIEEIVHNFFEKYKIRACCEPYTSVDWFAPMRNDEFVCNYFVAAETSKCPNSLAPESSSEDDGFFESPTGGENIAELNNQYDVVGEPEIKTAQTEPQRPRCDPETLLTICVRYLHNLLYKPTTGESHDTHADVDNIPLSQTKNLFHLCIEQLQKTVTEHRSSENTMNGTMNVMKHMSSTEYSAEIISNDMVTCRLSSETEINAEVPRSRISTIKPAKLSTICLRAFCKYSKTALSLNCVNLASPVLINKPIVVPRSLKILCHAKIVSIIYKVESNNVLLGKKLENTCEGVLESEYSHIDNDTESHSDISLTLSQYENDFFDNYSIEKVESLKSLSTKALNAIMYSSGDQQLGIPAITDIRQINNFTTFIEFDNDDDDSVGDECEFPDDNEYEEPDQSSWVAKIKVRDLKSFVHQVSSSQLNEESNALDEESSAIGEITLKLEPIDQEENEQVKEVEDNRHDPFRVKVEKDTVVTNDNCEVPSLTSNNMVIVPNVNVLPKLEKANDSAVDPLLANLTEDFLDNTFQEILRRNKMSIQGDNTPPSRDSPIDIFTQRHNRIRRQFEPDSDHEADAMELLVPQSFRDINVQPSNKAKGTLLESSSEGENKEEDPVKRKRGRPRKNKNKNKTENKKAPPPPVVPSPPVVPAVKEKVHNEIEILTRRMRERIINEERQKESSTDSENEVLYSLKQSNATTELQKVDHKNHEKVEAEKLQRTLDKKSIKNRSIEEKRTLRSQKQTETDDKTPAPLTPATGKGQKEASPDFPGFSSEATSASEAACLRSYMQYMQENHKGEDDIQEFRNNINENIMDNDDHFNDADEFDYGVDMAEEQVNDADPTLSARTESMEDLDNIQMEMLVPKCDIVVDEHNKIELNVNGPKKRGRKKKNEKTKEVSNDTAETSQKNVEIQQGATVQDVEKILPIMEIIQGNADHKSVPEVPPETNIATDKEVNIAEEEMETESGDYTLRDGWKCHKISDNDVKLYQLCYVPMEKLPDTFVETYLEFVQISREGEERDSEIDKLTNLKSLHRTPHQREEDGKRQGKPGSKPRALGEQPSGAEDDREYRELEPSDDEHDPDKETPSEGQVNVKTENTLAKNMLMDEPGSDSASENEDKPLLERKRSNKKEQAASAVDPKSLMLTADKVMKKDLELLHAPVVLDKDRSWIKPHSEKVEKKPHKPGTSNRERRKSDSDVSSEEEKQWITTKEKLLKRLEKKNQQRLEIDDDKRARIVSDYIEKKADEKTNAYAGQLIKQRRRLKVKRKTRKQKEKELRILQMELQRNMAANGGHFEVEMPIHGKKGAQSSYFRGRRNIRKVIDKKSLARSTLVANMEEIERKRRLAAKRQQLCAHFGCEDPSVKAIIVNKELCLEFDFEKNRSLISVHPAFTSVMKAHQCEGVKFMWDASFETLEQAKYGHPGGGCILAHCMGLGKTLQVLALLHTVMTHKEVGVKRVLVCCPLSTVLNWVDEIHKWMGPVPNKIKVFELSKLKKTYERAYQLEEWCKMGGIFIVGYELFRSLSTLNPMVDNIRSTIIDKINTALIDPGPDVVVCDEGHLLKNDCSALAVAMSRVKTRRRIVLTGTPMQNNLREYYCMVNFVKPNLLGTYSEFSNRFENPIMNGQHRDSSDDDIRLMKFRSHILHKVLEGCLQRQEASVLYPYLPKKYEYTVFISLSKCQSDMYRHYLDYYTYKNNKQNVLKDFHVLQKIWTHPQVLHNFQMKVRDDVVKDEVKMEDDLGKEELGSEEMQAAGAGGEVWWTQYLDGGQMMNALNSSNKLQVVFRILDECVRIGDKLLIFSTSLMTLDTLEYFLKSINKWSLGHEYYRLDGSVPPEVRQKWCREFNADNNTDTRLFLISTRAGCLGLNMTAANRVIILDTSWNPAHDIQSIFRVYRFGQRKDCFIYRLVSMGTMEQKIYERSVTKQAVACRVVDEQQIDRHYNMAELTELYSFEELDSSIPPTVSAGDSLLLSVTRGVPAVRAVHEHDSLLRDSCDQQLPEHERAAAWDQFQREQAHTQNNSLKEPQKRRKKGQMPTRQNVQIPILQSLPGDGAASAPPPLPPSPPLPPLVQLPAKQTTNGVPDSPSKRTSVKPKRYRLASSSSTDSIPVDAGNDPDWEEQDESQPLASFKQVVNQPILPESKVMTVSKAEMPVRVYSGRAAQTGAPPQPPPASHDETIELSDSENDAPQKKETTKTKGKIEVGKRMLFKAKPPPTQAKESSQEKTALHPSLLTNPYFLKIVAHTYRSWNPNLGDDAAMAAATYSANMLKKKPGDITGGTLYDIAVKTLGLHTMQVLWKNYHAETMGESPGASPSPSTSKDPPRLSIEPGKVPSTLGGPPAPQSSKAPVKLAISSEASVQANMSPAVPATELRASTSLPKLRVMSEELLRHPKPKPMSLRAGPHPSSVPMELMHNTVQVSDGEEESILPDDDTPRIGNASPPPAPPPPIVLPTRAPSPPPLAPSTRTARKKTTQKNGGWLPPLQSSDYDVITLPAGQEPARPPQQLTGQAPKRFTILRKQLVKPTHVLGPNNSISILKTGTLAQTPMSQIAPVPMSQIAQVPMSQIAQVPAPDTTICLDSEDEDIAALPDSSTSKTPTQPKPLILNHSLAQSEQASTLQLMSQPQAPVPTGPILTAIQMQQMQAAQIPMNVLNSNQMQSNMLHANQQQANVNIAQLPPNLQSIIQCGKRVGNVIMIPADAFKGTSLEGSSSFAVMAPASCVPKDTSAPPIRIAPKPSTTVQFPVTPAPPADTPPVPLLTDLTTEAPVLLEETTRKRGRPRKQTFHLPETNVAPPEPQQSQVEAVSPASIKPGEKLVYTRSKGFMVVKAGQSIDDVLRKSSVAGGEPTPAAPSPPMLIQPAKPLPPAPQPTAPPVKVNAVKRPNKPPSAGIQEPTSTTADEPSPSVDLTEGDERRRRSTSSSSTSSSSSSSSAPSSRASSPDNPLNIFKNVVQIQAPTINIDDEPPYKLSKSAHRSAKPNKSSAKPGSHLSTTESNTAKPSLTKPVTNSVTSVKSSRQSANSTKQAQSTSKPGTSQGKARSDEAVPGPSSARPELSSAKPRPSSPKPGSNTSKSGVSSVSAAKKTSMVLKKIGKETASWQQPKTLQKKPSPEVKGSVDLTSVDSGHQTKSKKPEKLLGTVDLTDDPVVEKSTASGSSVVSHRGVGVTHAQGPQNITLTKTGGLAFTKSANTQESTKPKVTNVMKITADTSPKKSSASEKRKAPPPPPPPPPKKIKKAQPTSLEDFDIDDIMEDVIELE